MDAIREPSHLGTWKSNWAGLSTRDCTVPVPLFTQGTSPRNQCSLIDDACSVFVTKAIATVPTYTRCWQLTLGLYLLSLPLALLCRAPSFSKPLVLIKPVAAVDVGAEKTATTHGT